MKNVIKKLKKKFLVLIFLASLSLLWILYTYNDNLQYQTTKTVSYKNLDTKKQYSEKTVTKYKDIELNFDLILDPKQNISEIIRIGSSNNAIVLKLVKPSSLQIDVGYDDAEGIRTYRLTDLFEFNTLH